MRRTDPSALAWLVGGELRQARERVGETQAAAAKVIGCSTSRMNYLETGRTVQQADDVRALMRFYGAEDDGERLARLVRQPGKRAWWAPWRPVVPQRWQLYLGLEGMAASVFDYRPQIVPELLQTGGYAAALVELGAPSPVVSDRLVDLRLARQHRLTDLRAAPRLAVVLDEEALDRPVGGPSVLREQLGRLLELGERANVTIQVMPRAVAVHDGLDGPFTLLEFAEAAPVVHLGTEEHGSYLADRHLVAGYAYRAQRIRASALTEPASRDLITARHAAL